MQRKATIRHNAARLACVLLAFLTFALPSAATPAGNSTPPFGLGPRCGAL